MSESAQALNVSLRHAYNRKLLNRQLHKFLRNKLSVLGMIIMLLILLSCIFYPIFTTLDYKAMDLSMGATLPRAGHLFGSDQLGRDLFLRCMVGGRYSIFIGVTSAVSSALFLSPAAFLSAAGCFFSAITSLHPAGRPSLPRFSSITRKPSYKGDISRIASS